MQYISFAFAGFILLSLLIYYLVPLKVRWAVLLTASLSFYIINSKYLLIALIASALSVFIGAYFIDKANSEFKEKRKELEKEERKAFKNKIRKSNKLIISLVVVFNVLLIVVFKYFGFLTEIINSIVSVFGIQGKIPVLQILAPIGISYYTLMAISYITDVFRGRIKAEKNYFKLLLFLSFFPHIVEGPIGRYGDLSKELYKENRFEYSNFQIGLFYIIFGLIKKMVIADRLAIFVNEVFDNSKSYHGALIIAAIILYAFQLYADFSGCIDVVTGVSRLYGIRLAKNFNNPFLSKSVQEFWRRWHITLGSWLRDYVFYPVSLSKGIMKLQGRINSRYFAELVPALISNFCVWMIMGIWHGSSYKYVLYGFYYFVLISISLIAKPFLSRFSETRLSKNKAFDIFRVIRTFSFVCLGMMIFRSDSVSAVKEIFLSIGSGGALNIFEALKFDFIDIFLFVSAVIAIIAYEMIGEIRFKKFGIRFLKLPIVIRWILEIGVILFIMCVGVYGPGFNAADFIYGGF